MLLKDKACSQKWRLSGLFSLKLGHLVYAAAEQLLTNLQAKDITVQEAIRGSSLLVNYLKSGRTDAAFHSFYEQTVPASTSLTGEPVVTRDRKRPRQFEDGTAPHQHAAAKDEYRQFYFQALDCAINR